MADLEIKAMDPFNIPNLWLDTETPKAVADLEILKGGFSHGCAKRTKNFWVATLTSATDW